MIFKFSCPCCLQAYNLATDLIKGLPVCGGCFFDVGLQFTDFFGAGLLNLKVSFFFGQGNQLIGLFEFVGEQVKLLGHDADDFLEVILQLLFSVFPEVTDCPGDLLYLLVNVFLLCLPLDPHSLKSVGHFSEDVEVFLLVDPLPLLHLFLEVLHLFPSGFIILLLQAAELNAFHIHYRGFVVFESFFQVDFETYPL